MEKLNKLYIQRYRVVEERKGYLLSNRVYRSSAVTTVAKVIASIAPIATKFHHNKFQRQTQQVLETQLLGVLPDE